MLTRLGSLSGCRVAGRHLIGPTESSGRDGPALVWRNEQVVEQWNSANGYIFYGKGSELTGADRESQEISMLALHLAKCCTRD